MNLQSLTGSTILKTVLRAPRPASTNESHAASVPKMIGFFVASYVHFYD